MIEPESAEANQHQSDKGIEYSIDGDKSTDYHSLGVVKMGLLKCLLS